MLDSVAVREVCEESYLFGEYLSGARDIRPERHGPTGTGLGGGSSSGRGVGTSCLHFFDIYMTWFITSCRLRHNRNFRKSNNIINGRRNTGIHKLIIKKCHIPRNAKMMVSYIITHKSLMRVTISHKCILN